MKIAGVVVFYNPSDNNVSNISNYLKSVDKLYVIDNSEDDIARLSNTNKIEYIKLHENKGVAFALNEGAKLAIKNNYHYLLTLDQDSNINNDIISEMKNYLKLHKNDNIGLVSPYHDIGIPDDKSGEVEERLEVMTSGNIISLDAYQAVGGYKDWLFIDCVDYDFCMNLNCHGFKVIRLNNVIMKHELGNLTIHHFFGKSYPCFNYNHIRRYYMVRNNLYIRKLYSDKYPEYCNRLVRVQKGQAKRVLLFEKAKFKKLRFMYKGYRDFKKGIVGKIKI